QVDRQRAVPLVLSELKQLSDFGDPCVVDKHIQAPPALVGQIEHALDVRCSGDIRLDRSLPKFLSEGLCAIPVQVRQQQLRAIAYHASSAGSADATRSARDKRMNAVQPIVMTSACYRCRISKETKSEIQFSRTANQVTRFLLERQGPFLRRSDACLQKQ